MSQAILEGETELLAKLQRLGNAVKGDVLGRAAIAGMDEIISAAKPITPYKTGNLRRSEHSELEEATERRAVAKGGTDVEYAWPVEKRKPYLRPAFDGTKERAMDVAAQVLRGEIERAAA